MCRPPVHRRPTRQLPKRPAEDPGIETLTQGPIHEAFANPADLNATAGPIAPKQPPADVPEDPPQYMPEGAIWIPGYWLWDDDRDDFLWVTGVARVPPPGMRWIPGYYTEAPGGWQRVSGFWFGNEAAEVDYRPAAPPATLDTGPSSPGAGGELLLDSWLLELLRHGLPLASRLLGVRTSRTGSGCPRGGSGLPAASFIFPAFGIIRWAIAGKCLPPCTSARRCMPGLAGRIAPGA